MQFRIMDAVEINGDFFCVLGRVQADNVVAAPPGRFGIGNPVAVRLPVDGIHGAGLGHPVLTSQHILLDDIDRDHAGCILAEPIAEPPDAVLPEALLLAQPGDGVIGGPLHGATHTAECRRDPVAPVRVVTEHELP